MSAKRGVVRTLWSLVGKVLWFFLRLVLKVVATLGSRWAKKRLENHDREVTRERRRAKLLRR